ncbi:MAG: UDP-N-acetylglucosamine 1-carboxyvinyltransferase [Planctomycetes bacterium]|nr:UDP-N-acetylglucosamine 1-carboxyvinyltransferase [Planctomycetota bacterium]
MDKFVIAGGARLKGAVRVSGSKNAALPIMAACILAQGKTVLKNVPRLFDIEILSEILGKLGVSVKRLPNSDMEIQVIDDSKCVADYDLVSKMRASICVLGPLLAKRHEAKVSLPGGCVIGVRPIDLHIKGLSAFGANITVEHGYVVARAKKLKSAEIYLGGMFGSTVTGTANILMAAVLAEGTTIIENAACEPEVADLAGFLNKMGAKIKGIGTHKLLVKGVRRLKAVTYSIIPDRIEAGTFMVAAAVTNGNITIENCIAEHLTAVIDKLREIGVTVNKKKNSCQVIGTDRIKPVYISTLPYPGFPTDMQAQFCSLLSLADGISVITERVYPDRFMHVAELNRMGANIKKEGESAVIVGVKKLSGAQVIASDLRASAALVLAGLVAEGQTEITRVYHIDRGYEKIEEKFNKLGARIQRKLDKKLIVVEEK